MIAVERAKEYVGPSELSSTIVIGDTPRDIRHGQEAGAQVVAVASGYYSLSQLEKHRPDLSVESFIPLNSISTGGNQSENFCRLH